MNDHLFFYSVIAISSLLLLSLLWVIDNKGKHE